VSLPPCSDSSRAREESLAATASRVERWLLVEHRGPWGPETVPCGRLDLRVSRRLAELAQEHRARLVLLRPAGGAPDQPAGPDARRVYAVDSRAGSEQVRTRLVRDDEELLALAPWREPDGWEVLDAPLYLVCTHGRHDRCCAVRGRPVAAALAAARPQQVWECSHLGGDRFAANLLVLPDGLYVGRVEAEEVVELVERLERGVLPLAHLRGRSSLTLPAQAAQAFARASSGRAGRNDLAPVAQRTVSPDVWEVRLSGPGGPDLEVVVRYVRDALAPAVLTCGAVPKVPPQFRLVELREAALVAG
jgi:hypothetical protein